MNLSLRLKRSSGEGFCRCRVIRTCWEKRSRPSLLPGSVRRDRNPDLKHIHSPMGISDNGRVSDVTKPAFARASFQVPDLWSRPITRRWVGGIRIL